MPTESWFESGLIGTTVNPNRVVWIWRCSLWLKRRGRVWAPNKFPPLQQEGAAAATRLTNKEISLTHSLILESCSCASSSFQTNVCTYEDVLHGSLMWVCGEKQYWYCLQLSGRGENHSSDFSTCFPSSQQQSFYFLRVLRRCKWAKITFIKQSNVWLQSGWKRNSLCNIFFFSLFWPIHSKDIWCSTLLDSTRALLSKQKNKSGSLDCCYYYYYYYYYGFYVDICRIAGVNHESGCFWRKYCSAE